MPTPPPEGAAPTLLALGRAAYEAGDHRQAISLLGRAAHAKPGDAGTYLILGLALLAAGEREAARAAFSLACLHEPGHGRAHALHGRALAALARDAEALASFDRALALDPASPDTHHERAALLMRIGRVADAAAGFRTVHRLLPADPAAAANLGAALQALNRPDEAEPLLSTSLARAPDQPATLSTRGLVHLARGDLAAALADLERSHRLAPSDPVIARHLAIGRYECDDLDGAKTLLDEILAEHPGDDAARLNRAIVDLAQGHLRRGWPGWESRLKLAPPAARIDAWTGEARAAPLVLTAEQGLGDTLQFLRYAPLAARRAGTAILSLPSSLRRAASGLGLPVVEPGRAGVPLGSLPLLFDTDLDTIPVPFAAWHDPRTTARWRKRLDERRPGARHIGIAWAGSPLYRQDRRRSIQPGLLAPLTASPAVQLVSLQQDRQAPGILDVGSELHDIAETAALIAALDLVVTVDTAMVHLAAGLGKPTWLLDRSGGDWRWLRGRGDSPWYPSLRIVRQPPGTGWARVLEQVAGEIAP